MSITYLVRINLLESNPLKDFVPGFDPKPRYGLAYKENGPINEVVLYPFHKTAKELGNAYGKVSKFGKYPSLTYENIDVSTRLPAEFPDFFGFGTKPFCDWMVFIENVAPDERNEFFLGYTEFFEKLKEGHPSAFAQYESIF